MKKIIKWGLAAALAAGLALSPLHITELQAAPQVFHETRTTQPITRNTYLHRSLRVTSAGVVDISVLEIPLNDPNITVSAFNSNVEFGLKQPTTTILNDNRAIAGVNGDFFGLAGRHSTPLGLEIIDGEMSIQGGVNRYANNTASFLMGAAGAFIEYVRPNVSLLLDGEDIFYVSLVNTVTDLRWASFLTYGYATSTASIDARLGPTYKLKVEDGRITAITRYTVDVPQNGFVVIMNPATFYENRELFYWGQEAEMRISANIDLEAIDTAISGMGRILYGGEVTSAANAGRSREPRTLLGLNAARDRLILMTVDGRGTSIGASLTEAAVYMRQFGADAAINMDGGGSTTMAATLPGGSMRVVNRPSGGAQRAVINAIGIVNHSAMGPVEAISITVPPPVPIVQETPMTQNIPVMGEIITISISGPQNIPTGMFVPLSVLGHDEYLNSAPLELSGLSTALTNADMADGGIVAQNPGQVIIQASDGQNYVWQGFNAIEVAEIIPSVAEISGNVNIRFTGVDHLGHFVDLRAASLTFEVFPESLGYMEAGQFTATGEGNGWLRASTTTASATRFIPISIYRPSRQIDTLDGMRGVDFSASGGVSGQAYFSTERSVTGPASVRLVYDFEASSARQFANLHFTDYVAINAAAYKLAIYGNSSGHRLRGNIVNADGTSHFIEFTRHIDFTGWRDLVAQVPANAAQPVRLTRVWVETEYEEEALTYEIFVDDLRVYERFDAEPEALPASTTARDPMRPQFMGERSPFEFDMTFMGPMTFTGAYAPNDWEFFRNLAMSAVSRDSVAAFYGGTNNISQALDIPTTVLGGYASLAINEIQLIQMLSQGGSFTTANAAQWERLRNDLTLTTMENIVIQTNASPLGFGNTQEFAIFHDMLVEHARERGANVFVVSNGGNTTTVQLRDGIRYINLATLFVGATPNPEFSILRFRFGQGGLQYSLERIFS